MGAAVVVSAALPLLDVESIEDPRGRVTESVDMVGSIVVLKE